LDAKAVVAFAAEHVQEEALEKAGVHVTRSPAQLGTLMEKVMQKQLKMERHESGK
jgi:succinyl-CoA synthetase alpha subunit